MEKKETTYATNPSNITHQEKFDPQPPRQHEHKHMTGQSDRKARFIEFAKRDQAEKCATTAAKLNAIGIDHLMKHMDVPVKIPERVLPEAPAPPADFVRNVVGSSAGAGSAEYHIYRNNRKKEAARLRYMDKMAKMEDDQKAFDERRENLAKEAEEKTAKKRNKRQRQKEHIKAAREAAKKARQEEKKSETTEKSDSSSSDDDDDNES